MKTHTHNTGIILPHLGASQLVEEVLNAVEQTNKPCSLYIENVCVPYRQISKAIFNISETVFFNGKLIATTLFSCAYIQNNLNHITMHYFMQDLPWLRGFTDFVDNVRVLRHPELKLYTSSEEYARLISNYCNKEVEVCQIGDLIC